MREASVECDFGNGEELREALALLTESAGPKGWVELRLRGTDLFVKRQLPSVGPTEVCQTLLRGDGNGLISVGAAIALATLQLERKVYGEN